MYQSNSEQLGQFVNIAILSDFDTNRQDYVVRVERPNYHIDTATRATGIITKNLDRKYVTEYTKKYNDDVCGISFELPCLYYVQLNVACSRVGKPSALFVSFSDGKARNIVYHQFLQ